jgi:predicted Rossmann fold flavoprotein
MGKQVIVVGGGAAGMMAAGQAALNGAEVTLVEKMKRLGSKIAISGKGRCNLTNAGDIAEFTDYYPGNGKFLYAAFKQFDNQALINFLEGLGVKSKIERGGRVFPEADDAEVIVKALQKFLEQTKVRVILDKAAGGIVVDEQKRVSGLRMKHTGEVLPAKAVIMATGGASFPGTGSNGDGYAMAEELGHQIITPLPALVPLRTREQWPRELQGLTLKNVKASIWVEGRKKAEEFGEMLLTHFGISGPIILTLSRIASQALHAEQKVTVKIDLKPALSQEQLDLRLLRDFAKYQNKQVKNALEDLLPKRLIPVIIRLAEIDPEKAVNRVNKEERKRLGHLLQGLTLGITGTLGLSTAIVTCGGIDVKQINPATMESRLISGLFLAGEMIDIDGITGGYNLQAAFSTGYQAGKAAAHYVSLGVC